MGRGARASSAVPVGAVGRIQMHVATAYHYLVLWCEGIFHDL